MSQILSIWKMKMREIYEYLNNKNKYCFFQFFINCFVKSFVA